MDAIDVRGVQRAYGPVRALDGIDLVVPAGTAVAVLGSNGAGKTTLVEILEGHRRRDAGEVRVLGRDPARPTRRWRSRLGIVLQDTGIVTELSARELVAQRARCYPQPRAVDEVIEVVGLDGAADRRPHELSGGQQRRLEVALAVVGRPELLFLDEPTTGFDPGARRAAWAFVADLRTAGTTVVLTTHDLDEAAALAGRLVVVRRGRVVADATPQALREAAGPPVVRFRVPTGVTPPALRGATGVGAGGVTVTAADPMAVVRALSAWEDDVGVQLADLTVTRPSLEDAYLELIR